MLTYTQTMEKIENLNAKLKALKPKTEHFEHMQYIKQLHTDGKIDELEKAKTEYEHNTRKEQMLKRILTAYKSNAENLYILENMPKVIDIFNKYAGKKCGEKTKEKIIAEAKENGIKIYFTHDTVVFYMGLHGYDRKQVYTKYINGIEQRITDTENKINMLSTDMFHLPTLENVINDVEIYVQHKEAEFLKLKQMYTALEEAVKAYNENNPFKHQYIREGILYMD